MLCPVCGSDNLTEMYPADIQSPDRVQFCYTFSPEHSKTFRIVRCHSCSHVFSAPIPEDIARHYEDVVDSEYLRHSQSRKLAAEAVLRVIRQYTPSNRLLDIGCATGDFLECAKEQGYFAEGLEVSRWASEIVRERGFKVHREFLETFAKSHPEQYDIVTLWGVIEHFAQPIEEIRHLRRLLKPGGILALWTGDVDSVTSRLLGRKWWYWQGQHIQYFSRKSLKHLVVSNGFEHVTTKRYPFAATYETISNSLRRYPAVRPFLLGLLFPIFAIKPVWYLRLPGEMFFLARRLPDEVPPFR